MVLYNVLVRPMRTATTKTDENESDDFKRKNRNIYIELKTYEKG